MNKSTITLPEIKLVGITARTSNANEMRSETAKIPATIEKFFGEDLQAKIVGRKNPGRCFAVYTNYAHDVQGEYTYFFGEAVVNFEAIPDGLEILIIPQQVYVIFTEGPGVIPIICTTLWNRIGQMGSADLGGVRSYIADFEIYDERSQDPKNGILDIYIGINQNGGTWVGEINVTPLLKAFEKFERFRMNDRTEQERAGIIQAFEYSFELSWKTIKRVLEDRGISANSPKEVFRMAARDGLIGDCEMWFGFLKKRNMTVHTYNQTEADEVLSICADFSVEMRRFLANIGIAL